MSMQQQLGVTQNKGFMAGYLDALALVERLHRLLLDVVKDEFERVGVLEINAVQALLLFNIGENEVTAGELKSRGYYQGSNVSYNLKMFVTNSIYVHVTSQIPPATLECFAGFLRGPRGSWRKAHVYIPSEIFGAKS
ncbi:hypothetical protein SuNHUV7_01380 (plasmid) [Pseudoseohaeicola sp. NH-UV-7]|uniref:hypothetical protein n=1 Tax=Sulfitobacter sp. TBRI5 TaxID=2989732 RepID=UPI003A6F2F27